MHYSGWTQAQRGLVMEMQEGGDEEIEQDTSEWYEITVESALN